jgi:hypothetical protein
MSSLDRTNRNRCNRQNLYNHLLFACLLTLH